MTLWNSGRGKGMATTKLMRVQEKGQVTLPAQVRRRYGIKQGDLVGVTETADGILITPTAVIAARALDEIGAALTAKGITLEGLIESGRQIRGELVKEHYGLESVEDE